MDLADQFHEIQRDNAHFQTQVLEQTAADWKMAKEGTSGEVSQLG